MALNYAKNKIRKLIANRLKSPTVKANNVGIGKEMNNTCRQLLLRPSRNNPPFQTFVGKSFKSLACTRSLGCRRLDV